MMGSMNSKALQFASRFSLPPNSLGYCGKNTAPARFKECIIEEKCESVAKELRQFIVLNPYLKTLAKISKKPRFSYEVIESYWLGNDLLTLAKREHYELLLDNFIKQGVPDFFVAELQKKQPHQFIPNHLFQVLHVGVGRASGAVPFSIQTINNCMIRWGRVKKIQKEHINVALHSLREKKHGYMLTKRVENVPFDSLLVANIQINDIVAVHWNMVIKVLNAREENNLQFWTEQVIASI